MPSSYTEVTSSSQLSSILSSHGATIVDFHATWCGPCHAIAPVFEQLASAHAAAGKVAFAKVDTDQNRDIVTQYGISAMPTFLIFKGTSVTQTIRGANPGALRAAVTKAAGEAGPAKVFENKGYRLGGDDKKSSSSSSSASQKPATGKGATGTGSGGRKLGAAPPTGVAAMIPDLGATADSMVRFMGLYLTTLFSFDPYAAAANSPLSVNRRR